MASSEPFHVARQNSIVVIPSASSTGGTSSSASSSSSSATTQSVSTTAQTSASSSSAAQTTAQTTSPGSSSSGPSSTTAITTTPPSTSVSLTSSTVASDSTTVTTDAGGSVVTVVVPASPSPTSSSAAPSNTSPSDDASIHPATIIGLSVAGGVAAIAIIAFIVWKLTRKRFSDLDDPNEAIKWPELNRDTGGGSDGLSRQVSKPYTSSRNASTVDPADFVTDPYAVPPLPQFNPNQPYHDDPYGSSTTGYYDPYRGPIPQTFHDGSIDGHESIPMNAIPPGSRSRSPGPGMAYDMGGRGSPAPGRASPAPGSGYDMGGRGSPAMGRTDSPGPAAALGYDRRPSPGPQYAFGGQP
ncbi:hypothetical protein K439DRAFT_1645059 [Ramaria rubella]|nr:hypothetical protein K439DRAFT_1645059 [Ramaria rubella]